MKSLLIIDVQNGFLNGQDKLVEDTVKLAKLFKDNNDLVIAMKHIEENENDPIYFESDGANIPDKILENVDEVIEKRYPISFKETNLDDVLKSHNIKELYITGFNMEFCILFTSISAADRGYEVTVIEDLCGTVNGEDAYEMPGLDIVDFLGTVMDWSGVMENKYLEELEFSKDL
ncbi:cysteine hydrolase family protein [Aliicoccus persicus]|uniref:Nicotinamidase-related amidase n=1 Tax=Aliicoccus persicus TaxID=930138 RepID=A0A662Z4C8_9STAP|nr:isochorismatase family cysteine hydrolase [Aliicoccus persicus]SEV91537.1 Nicotinamidase-related amidase [Aliicoccus persicus]